MLTKSDASVGIAFGKSRLPLNIDPELAEWEIIRPVAEDALADPQAAFELACGAPIGSPPLKDIVSKNDKVVIVTSDGTRPVPNKQLIPWIIEHLSIPLSNVTILLGNGSHRPNTAEEILEMFGEDIDANIEICNHDGFSTMDNQVLGTSSTGGKILVDKKYLEADKRIVIGFIEPHFFAGFSGGSKGVIPGMAGVETIRHLHRAELLAHPDSTWGQVEGNPIQVEIAEMLEFCPPEFMVNVTLNLEKQITGVYAGNYREAHRAGYEKVKAVTMVPVKEPFPIVITSNSGHPLDQNLYQTVKGISAASRIVAEGGAIFVASECSDGIPDHGNFAELMQAGPTPQAILNYIHGLEEPIQDQWQAQILARDLNKAQVYVYAHMEKAAIEKCKLIPVDDLQSSLEEYIGALENRPRIAVMPDGPITIPYLQ